MYTRGLVDVTFLDVKKTKINAARIEDLLKILDQRTVQIKRSASFAAQTNSIFTQESQVLSGFAGLAMPFTIPFSGCIHTDTSKNIYIYICMYINIYIYICMDKYIYIYICMDI